MYSRVRARLPSIYQHSRSYASSAVKNKTRIGKYGLVGVAAGSALTVAYHLSHDEEVINTAEGAHLTVPKQAFRPHLGGFKQLPVVSHFLDDSIHEENTKPRLVVIGSGWGAVSVLEQLEKDDYNVTVISENNYFLFTPLLPSATVGTLEMR
jgi:NADH dehydrogenase